ncbi:MAG: YfiR family protein [Rickettsiales bacterium]|nr:YfiR family protein [Rickettsiales bacterium]
MIIKASYLYNLTHYVRWPEPLKPRLEVCLPQHAALQPFMTGLQRKKVNEATFSIRTTAFTRQDLMACDLIYFDATSPLRVLNPLSERPVLTVGEGSDFLALGGMLSFQETNGRIALSINLQATRKAGLEVSPSLLEIAYRVIQ